MINICKICGQYSCPSSCPEFDGFVEGLGNALGECEICSSRCYTDDGHFCKDDKYLCVECAEILISPELLQYLDCVDIKEFFDMLL